MKLQLIAVALVLAATPAAAQTQQPWQKVYTPQTPKAPSGPTTPPAPAFKPFQGSSVYSNRGGLNAYPAPSKPKSTFTSIYGPDKPKK